MNAEPKSSVGLERRARSLAIGCVLFLSLGGCAGAMENVLVNLQPYESPGRGNGASAPQRAAVLIEPVADARRDIVGNAIGERTTIGNISMGGIEMEPIPTVVLTQVLRAELMGLGFSVVAAGEQFKIGARATKFRVSTPATALYWDMDGVIELDVTVSGKGGKTHDARYEAKCTDRTYVFPSEELITKVVSACVKDIGAKIRGDAALIGFLSAR